MMHRFWAVFKARNLEFVRDRASFGWNIALPVFLVLGMGFLFSGGVRPLFKIGVVHPGVRLKTLHAPILETRYIKFFTVKNVTAGIHKVARQQINMLLDYRHPDAPGYWVNTRSPKGYILEKLLTSSTSHRYRREPVNGRKIRYIDWLIPGILGINMMFSCLFGVGYVIVRYRKNGYLKRLSATPLKAIEFISAQIASRLILILGVTVAVFIGTWWLIHFYMIGNCFTLFIVALLGAIAMTSLGLLVSARLSSEELAGGLLNLISWPMMVLSGVWFSLEGMHPWLQRTAEFLPLTQMLQAARAVMLDGAGLEAIGGHLLALVAMSALFLLLGAVSFKWKSTS